MKPQLQRLAAIAALGFASLGSQAAPVVVDVSGAQSTNLQGEAGNTVWFIDIGANAALNSLTWAVELSAFAPSSLYDMQVSFGTSSGTDAINLAPDVVDGFSGTGSYSGFFDLAGLGLTTGADGLLRLEFSETYKDFALDVVEGRWVSGSLTFDVTAAAVPEPGSAALALLALGGLWIAPRRPRRH